MVWGVGWFAGVTPVRTPPVAGGTSIVPARRIKYIFSSPLRSGTLKYLCLSLLDARNLETALHRFGQFFHIVVDDFFVESKRDGLLGQVVIRPNPAIGPIGSLGQELMLKLVHGVCSWLIGQKIPLLQIEFACRRPRHAVDHLYFFSGRCGSDTAQAVLDESAKFCGEALAPLNVEGDRNPSSWSDGAVTATPGFKDAFKQFAEGGWQGLQHPVVMFQYCRSML